MNGIRRRYGARVAFVRLDVGTPVAKALMARWGIRLNSTSLVFDGRGREVWRSSRVPFPARAARRVLDRVAAGGAG